MSSTYRRYAPKRDEIPSTSASGRRNLSVAGEPSTTGTSWTSLRFNKSMTDGYRGHSSRLASTFESKPSSYAPSTTSLSSRYSTASTTATEKPAAGYVRSALENYQKAVASSERPTRTRPSVAGPLMTYRSQVARDMFSPTRYVPSSQKPSISAPPTDREPTSRSALANTYLSRTKSPPSRSIFSPSRHVPDTISDTYTNRSLSTGRPYSTISSASSTASYQPPPLSRVTSSSLASNPPRRPVSSYEPDSLSLAVTKVLSRPTLKSERPWRQRMADAARFRNIHGEDMSNSVVSRLTATRAARRNSIGQNSGDELQNSLNALKSFVADPTASDKNSAISKYRAKNGNPLEVSDPRPIAGFTNKPAPTAGSLRPYRTSGYGKTLSEAQMSESYAGSSTVKPVVSAYPAMSRSYSPNRSGSTLFDTSPRTSYRYPSHESVHLPPHEPLFRDKGQTIIEEIQERWGESSRRRHNHPRSSKERTARHNSRQRSLSKEPPKSPSSSEDEAKKRQESRDPPKKRRLRKRTSSIPKKAEPPSMPPTVLTVTEAPADIPGTKEALQPSPSPSSQSTQLLPTVSIDLAASSPPSSTSQISKEARVSGGSSIGLVTASGVASAGGSNTSLNIKTEEEFKSAQSSPQISPMGNKTSKAASPAVSPKAPESVTTPQKPASALQRVLAPFRRKSSKLAIKAAEPSVAKSPTAKTAPVAREESVSEISVSEATSTTAPTTTTAIDEDESQYNAVTEFKPGKSRKNVVQVKSMRPVPGMWQGTTNEINISCNRNLTRKVISNLAVEAICRDQAFLKAVPKRFKQPVIKKKKALITEQSLEVVLVGHPQPPKEKVYKTLQLKRPLLVYKVEGKFGETSIIKKAAKLKQIPVSALAVLNQEFSSKKPSKFATEKAVKTSVQDSGYLSCKASKENVRNVELNIRRKEEKRTANVTVIAVDVMDVNWAKASKKLKAIVDPLKKNLAELIEQQAAIIEAEKERLSRTPRLEDDDISSCSDHRSVVETQASLILTGLRNINNSGRLLYSPELLTDDDSFSSHIPVDSDYRPGEPLVLPDKSILEEYVRRKRGELERLHSEPLRSPSRASPCLSTTSELLPACAVRIVEPRNRAIAHLSAPTRATADSIESHSLPSSNRNSQMIELMTFPANFDPSNNNNGPSANGFRAALRKPIPRREALTIQHFDTPKTPFEAAMQNQAAQMAKKSSVASNLSGMSESEAQDLSQADSSPLDFQHRRRPSVESTQSMPPIASGTVGQGFAQAAALASQPRHERYAAHIPVRQTSIEPSGRQSTTSIDSANSGVLDTASRQLDQMIDQARYRHHQHRSKFKEAIDYLDQIFEDLKKEVEPPTSISSEHKTEVPAPVSARGIQAAKAVFQKPTVTVAHQPQAPSSGPQTTTVPIVRLRKPSELSQRQQQHIQGQSQPAIIQPKPARSNGLSTSASVQAPKLGYPTPLRQPLVASNNVTTATGAFQPQPSTSAATATTTTITAGPKPFPKLESADVEISETIVLPSKGNPEKMNFTRQWLAGDIKSWADKPDLIVPSGELTSPNDSDDRSIGSCSAEVAAINAIDRRRKRQVRETPDIIKSSKAASNGQPKAVKPQPSVAMPTPVRPHPLRPQPQYAPFPINGQLPEPIGLQKAPSHEYVMSVQRGAHPPERAGSQDYQSLGSVHSQDGYKPLSTLSLYSNSLNRSGAFQQYPQRGSIHSLPDASLRAPPQAQQDPILAIDALVAELELNTDPDRGNEKRRSFPTGHGFVSAMAPTTSAYRNPQRIPVNASGGIPRQASLNLKPQPLNNGGSMDRGLRRMQAQQRSSLDEMANMLTNVAGDLKASNSKPISNGHHHPQQQPHGPKKVISGIKAADGKMGYSPFETINQERIAPSRVGAMQQVFETKKQPNANGSENGWRKAAPSKSTSKEEENYYEIQEYSQTKVDRPSPMLSKRQGSSPLTPSRQPSFTGSHHAFPLPQPPSVPPPPVSSCVSSANSSQHGYYSSSTSSVGRSVASRDPPSTGPQRRGSFAGKHSISSRAPSFDDDDDDGFYDNIQVDNRRFSEADNASVLSHQLPPTQKGTGRLGQLIRRIGGHRPPTNASSSMSLNKMGLDGSVSNGHGHPLMKSNSLSNDPWRAQIIEGDKRASHPGIGYRLKQSIFGGSKKRLN